VSELRFESVGVLGTGLVSALFATTRAERVSAEHYLRFRDEGTPVIFVFWHGQLLPLIHYHRREGIVVLVSEHDDGEYITRVLHRNGFRSVRGSSTRGGTKGLRALIRAARAGHDLALTPDGPRGPARVFKPGALLAAQVGGWPIIPMAVGVSSAWRARSWDGFLIPRPLSAIRIEYGQPVHVPRDAGRDALDALGRALGDRLNEMTERLNHEGADPGREDAAAGAPETPRRPPGASP
jgi:lysophospholipid acyltransferase (LPLAT)-like uncharacterized protein